MAKPSPELDDEYPPWRRRTAERFLGLQFWLYTLLVVFLLGVTFLWPYIFISIPPGSRGVMYRYFGGGTVPDQVWSEGLHIIPPWDTLTIYEVRLQSQRLSFDVLSAEGLSLTVEVAVRFQPNVPMLGYLQQDIGAEYFERLVRPEIESHVRRTFGERPAHELYSSARDVLQELSQVSLIGRKSLAHSEQGASEGTYVNIYELKLIRIVLPEIVETAIAEKYRQEQLMLEYAYRLEREENEAERKRTEAAGIRDYNLIAGQISHDLLRWRSIDATQALATASNSKVVVLGGGGNNGMQMLLNVDGASNEVAAPANPVEAEPQASIKPAKPVAAKPEVVAPAPAPTAPTSTATPAPAP